MLIKTKTSNGINIPNTDFEEYGVKYYVPYKGTVSETPLNEVYTSPNYTSISSSSVSPLVGYSSGLISKTGFDAKGEGIYIDFTIDEGITNDTIQLSFLYKTSSDYVDNDINVFIYDRTSNVIIPSSNIRLTKSSIVSKFITTFSPSVNLNYRIYFHIRSTNALAYQVKIDDIILDNKITLSSSAISEWQSYTPTFQGFGTPTAVDFKWRRVGSNIEVKGKFTSGTATAVEARISLPSGMTSRSDVPTLEGIGHWVENIATPSSFYILNEASKTYVTIGYQSGANGALAKINGSTLAAAGTVISVFFSLPIAEWTSNINVTTDFTEYAFNTQAVINTNDTTSFGYGSGGTPILANTAETYYEIQFSKPVQATDLLRVEVRSIIDGSWIPIELASVYSLKTCALNMQLIYNGSGNNNASGIALTRVSSTKYRLVFSTKVWASSTAIYDGGYIQRTWASIIAAADGFDRWRVRKISNGNMAEVPPIVAIDYKTTDSYTGPGIGTPFNFSVKNPNGDIHNAVTTGASWKFTAPIQGWYNYDATLPCGASQYCAIFKNGSEYKRFGQFGGSTAMNHYSITGKLWLLAGEYIDFRTQSTVALTVASHVSIARLGG